MSYSELFVETRGRGLRALVALTLALSAAPLAAQSGAAEKAAAEALFDQGLKLMQQGKHKQACEKLEQSQAIEAGIGTLLYLAECYAQLGRTASAWASFREAASAAAAQGQAQRAEAGARRARELEPKLSRLTVHVAPEAQALEGIEVRNGDVPLAAEAWGVAIPVDPGEHHVTASAPQHQSWQAKLVVPPNGASVEMFVPPLAPQPVAATPTAAQPQSTPSTVHVEADLQAQVDSSNGLRLAGLITGGAGVVALGLGTYFGLRAISKNNEAQDEGGCSGETCSSQQGIALTQDAQDAAALSNVFVGLGAVATAIGVVLYLLAPDEERPVQVSAAVAPDGRSGLLSLQGTF